MKISFNCDSQQTSPQESFGIQHIPKTLGSKATQGNPWDQNEDNYKLPLLCTTRKINLQFAPIDTAHNPPTYPSTKPSAKSAWFFKGMQK
jgi:hypothetical protein